MPRRLTHGRIPRKLGTYCGKADIPVGTSSDDPLLVDCSKCRPHLPAWVLEAADLIAAAAVLESRVDAENALSVDGAGVLRRIRQAGYEFKPPRRVVYRSTGKGEPEVEPRFKVSRAKAAPGSR